MCQLALEWGCGIAIARLDIAKAFDALDRRKLAAKLVECFGREKPWEVAMQLRMLEGEWHVLNLRWGTCEYQVGIGVKQGAVESPSLCAWVVSLVMLQGRRSGLDADNWLDGCPVDRMAFMDDVISWSRSTVKLQEQLCLIQHALAE